MNTFTANRIKNLQLDFLWDSCTIDSYSSGSNSLAEIIETWTSGSEINCGYKSNTGSKSYGETETRLKYAAIVRINDSQSVTYNDKVTVTKISGSSITPITYKISSIETGHGLKILGCEIVKV